jgi:hypothetical protein
VGKDFTLFLYVSETGENYPETVLKARSSIQEFVLLGMLDPENEVTVIL